MCVCVYINNSYLTVNWGAGDTWSNASQLLSDNYLLAHVSLSSSAYSMMIYTPSRSNNLLIKTLDGKQLPINMYALACVCVCVCV